MKKLIRRILRFPFELTKRAGLVFEKVKIPFSCRLNGRIHIVNRGKINIGEGCVFNGANKYNPIGFAGPCNIIAERGAVIKIGDNCGMSAATIYARSSVTIGDRVLIGGGVKIYDTDFHSLDYKLRGTFEDKANTKNSSVVIEDDVFIGAGSFVLKGVHIGKCAIVGAGSVVTKDIPEGEIWAGNPAKRIK